MGQQIGRRDLVRAMGLGTVAAALGTSRTSVASVTKSVSETAGAAAARVEYVLPPLPYAYDALMPFLSDETLTLHHDKHHRGYVNGLNRTLGKLAAAGQTADYSAIKSLSRDLAFHGSGHVLHTLYWRSMTPGGSRLGGTLAALATRDFGSTRALQDQVAAAARAAEASGWAVLAYEPLGRRLLALQAEKHQNLAIWGVAPLLVCDVWEHAYYVDYRNRRADYVAGFMEAADWAAAEKRLATALRGT